MKLLWLSSEVAPYSKTGGLADVVGALPEALAALGHQVRLVSPLYAFVPRQGLVPLPEPLRLEFPFATLECRVHELVCSPTLTLWFIEQPELFDRAEVYGERNTEYPDNARRFGYFTMAGLTASQRAGFVPDVVHVNDWPTCLAALALKRGYSAVFPRAKSVLTIHNLAYQGNFPKHELESLGIPWSEFHVGGVEFWDRLSFLKTGLQFADAITTVSPTYAKEIQTPSFGVGLDGVVRAQAAKLTGILNAVDAREWNPATDVLLPERFSVADLEGRAQCRRALLARTGLEAPTNGLPIFGVIGRMVEQKGVDLVQAVLPAFLEHGASAVVLGAGAGHFEHRWRELAARFPKRLSVTLGFDNSLAHLIEAGCDFFLMPSRFEPCGLNQLYSQLYGAVPVVHGVGGLVDTVTDVSQADGTGIVFSGATSDSLGAALTRAVDLFRDHPRLARAQKQGMSRDFSWAASAKQYDALYRSLTAA